jgi:hypothetical protein
MEQVHIMEVYLEVMVYILMEAMEVMGDMEDVAGGMVLMVDIRNR